MVAMADVTVALGVALSLPADIRKHLKEFCPPQFKPAKVTKNSVASMMSKK